MTGILGLDSEHGILFSHYQLEENYLIVISVFHCASLSVTFTNQLMHSIITVVDVKIYVT